MTLSESGGVFDMDDAEIEAMAVEVFDTYDDYTGPPISPLGGWMGGKSRLCKVILPLIPQHKTYCEPFAGAAWVFFKKPKSSVEVLNDLDGNIANFFKVVRDDLPGFLKEGRLAISSRDWFMEYRAEYEKEGFKDLAPAKRAWMFFYLLKNALNGRLNHGPTYNCGAHDRVAKNIRNSLALIKLTSERLQNVGITNEDFAIVMQRFDREDAFFYIDPPYFNVKQYRFNFENADFFRLVETLKGIKGKFLMSMNKFEDCMVLFKDFRIKEVPVIYPGGALTGGKHKSDTELLISNYELPRLISK